MKTIKECTKCEFRLSEGMFEEDKTICIFCEPKEDKNGET